MEIGRNVTDNLIVSGLESCDSCRNLFNNLEGDLVECRLAAPVLWVLLYDQVVFCIKVYNFIRTCPNWLELPINKWCCLEILAADD